MKVQLQEKIIVQRSLADCFRYVRDFSTIEQWDPGVYRAEKLTPGMPREGSEFLLQLKIGGKRVPMRYVLTRCVDNVELELQGRNDTLAALDTLSFSALDDEHTEITYTAELTLSSLPQALRPVMMPSLNRLGKKAAKGLAMALDVPARAPGFSLYGAARDQLIVPAALDFTERGYLAMPNKGLSQFMDGKTVLITGPTSGLGLAAACELARLGATLLLVGRGRDRLESARRTVQAFSGADPARLYLYEAELSLLAEVERVAREIAQAHPSLDVLINNAGVLPARRELTREGNELALAVNLLAPVALTQALQKPLRAARGRVINVASGGMYLASLHLDDMQSTRPPYNGAQAYARAKRALVALTEHMAVPARPHGVDFHAMHPGWAATPGVARSLPAFNKKLKGRLRDARMGADTVVWLASARELRGVTGKFWFDRAMHRTSVLPGTAVSHTQKLALQRWLWATLAEHEDSDHTQPSFG